MQVLSKSQSTNAIHGPVFGHPEFDGHEKIMFGHDPETRLFTIIAVHDTRLGPPLGGCRMWPYENSE